MKLENQVVSLELAKKLKELGVKQESLFQYRQFNNGKEMFWSIPIMVGKIPEKLGNADVGFDKISAFTVNELGEMLPKDGDYFVFKNGDSDYFYCQRKNRNCNEFAEEAWEIECIGQENTEADARAKMLVYLLENKLITL